jgi:serine/threonine protein phosphatase PrpC
MGRGAAADGGSSFDDVAAELQACSSEDAPECVDATGGWDRSQLCSGHAETIGRRPTMEDTIQTVRRFRGKADEDYWGLFDGHGGKNVSAWLADRLHGYLGTTISALAGKRSDAAVRSAVDEAFRVASAALRKEVSVASRMGSTAVIAMVLQRTLHIANCGDSRAVLCNAGNAHRLSFDHKPELPCERERIKQAGGYVCQTHPLGPARVDGVLSVSRSFGDFLLAPKVTWHPYHAERRLTAADEFVVLGCDGVWDVLDDQTAVDIGRKALEAGKPPKVAARQIMNASLQRGSTDNVSVIVLQLSKQIGGGSTSPNEDLLAAMEAAMSNSSSGAASSPQQQPAQADRFGDRMSGRGILTRLNPSPRRAARTRREFGGRSPRRGADRAVAVAAAAGGGGMSDGPADRRRQQRTADAERFSKLSMQQQQAHATTANGEDSDMSTTESDDSEDSPDEDLGGMWNGVHTPSKEVVKGAVESGAVVMARPLLNSYSSPAVAERETVTAAGGISGAAQSCNITPPGTLSDHSYRALTNPGATSSWGVGVGVGVGTGSAAATSMQPSPVVAGDSGMGPGMGKPSGGGLDVMGDVLGGGGGGSVGSSSDAAAAAGGHRHARKANRFG